MRRIFVIAALALAAPAALCFAQTADPQKAAQSQAAPQSPAPTGWSRTGGNRENYELTLDAALKHGGAASASLKAKPSATDGGFGSMMQEIRADEYRGKRVRLSGFLKAEGVGGHAALWMRVDGEGGKTLTFDNMDGRPVKGTADWKRYEIVLDVPSDAQMIAVGTLLAGKGQVWADDLSLEVVGRDVASTDMIATPEQRQASDKEVEEWKSAHKEEFEKAMQRMKERLPKLPTRPVNLDFEGK